MRGSLEAMLSEAAIDELAAEELELEDEELELEEEELDLEDKELKLLSDELLDKLLEDEETGSRLLSPPQALNPRRRTSTPPARSSWKNRFLMASIGQTCTGYFRRTER